MKESIKSKIIFHVTEKNDWVFGGHLEDFIRQTDGHKASNTSRRCRELVDAGILETRYVSVPETPNKVVQYRLSTGPQKDDTDFMKDFRAEFMKPKFEPKQLTLI